ncbi:MAG: glycosyltransferase family 2 protein [Phycisphaeraceae bacterium]|nr:MAG: glycosyltransferase family 2 protein [Phycisphaeraceae bacterium]
MRLTIIIPTRAGDGRTAETCLDALRDQLAPGDEVIVSVDGEHAPERLADRPDIRVVAGPKAGPGGARNRALEQASGEVILFLNDDVVAHEGLLDAHRRAHGERGPGHPAMVLGSAPWEVPADDRVIDRLVRATSMIFFYDRMTDPDSDRDWGFRHAWTLNLSLPASIMRRYDERLAQPMFDDLEWAARVQQETGAPVLYRPGACVTHRHRYTPAMLLRREALLGHQAGELHKVNPPVARDVFGDRYEHTPDRVGDHETQLCAHEAGARAAFADLLAITHDPADSIDDEGVAALFGSCRAWRDAARSIGFLGWAEGRDAQAVQADAEGRLAGSIAARAAS